jgi:hypothetical protein
MPCDPPRQGRQALGPHAIDASSPLNGCIYPPGGLQKLQMLNDSRARYRQTAREFASGTGCAGETLKYDYANRKTEEREQVQNLSEQRRVSVRFGHLRSVTPD